MTTFTEPTRALDFLISEANGSRSRDQVTLTASQGALVPGTVLAKVTATGNYVLYDDDANGGTPGAGVALAILCYPVENVAATQPITVISRDAEVDAAQLTWEASNDAGEITAGKADLAAVGIICR
jgi:Bacteriophage lambda head decoration protein D